MPSEQGRGPDLAVFYQIRIKGHLGQQWQDWFQGLVITLEEDGNTLLTGSVIDQPALHGILKKIRDLGMPLLSVNPVAPGSPDISDVKPSDVKDQQTGDS